MILTLMTVISIIASIGFSSAIVSSIMDGKKSQDILKKAQDYR